MLDTIAAVVLADSFYVDVMKQLVVAFGAALVVGNVLAMIRKQPPESEDGSATTLVRAPIWRSVLFVLLGLVMAIWGLASILR